MTAPTVIEDQSIEQELVPFRDAVFPCSATTDRSTKLTRRWLLDDEQISEDDSIFVSENGSLVILMSEEADGGVSRAGVYKCHATNGYSSSDIYVKLFTAAAQC